MEYDAFTAGVEPGGLNSSKDVKLLVCYLLAGVDEPIARRHLLELLQYEGLANYFEVGQAVAELQAAGNISLADEAEDTFRVTDTGREIARTLETALPYSVRQKAVRAATRLLARIKLERENTVTTEKSEGGYMVTCTSHEGDRVLMSVSLLVPDAIQAEAVKRQFLEDPLRVYGGTIALLTGDYDAVRVQLEGRAAERSAQSGTAEPN